MDATHTFKATYTDGTTLVGDENHSYESIDRARLRTFDIVPKSNHDDVRLRVHLEPGQRLVYRRRVRMNMGGDESHIYIVGKQETLEGRNVQRIAVFYPDTGAVELMDRFMDTAPFNTPELLPCETE